MTDKTVQYQELTPNLKARKANIHFRPESKNWRLKKAIDILLDYLLLPENGNSGDSGHPKDRGSKSLFTKFKK